MNYSHGYLELIIGPMYSGKTSSLIHIYNKYYQHYKILVVNHEDDTRYGSHQMSTHDGNKIPCVYSNTLHNISDIDQYDIILVNEGQFFHDLKKDVLELVEKKHKQVYIAGLDGDFKRNPFDNIISLIPYCDSIQKVHALCTSCKDGSYALFSLRLSKETDVKVIGNTNYTPLCRKCYNRVCQ